MNGQFACEVCLSPSLPPSIHPSLSRARVRGLLNYLSFRLLLISVFVLACAAIQLFGVKAKWLLALECVLVCLVLTPLINYMYNGMVFNELLSRTIWGECFTRTYLSAIRYVDTGTISPNPYITC